MSSAAESVEIQASRWRSRRLFWDSWTVRLFGVVAAMGIASWMWNSRVGLSFPSSLTAVAGAGIFGALAVVYGTIRPAPRIAEAAGFVVLWIGFTQFGARLSYLGATLDYPLQDTRLAALDATIGFDWRIWGQFLLAHPRAEAVLSAAYISFLPQLAASVVIFSFVQIGRRNAELLIIAVVSIATCIAISAALPAFGAWYHFAFGPLQPENIDLRALRSGERVFQKFNGIISFPSFHAVMAIAFTYAHRGLRWSFPPFLVLNATMLVATIGDGGHYLVDLIGGAVVAVCSIALARHLLREPSAATAPKAATRPG